MDSDLPEEIAARLARVRERIAEAAGRARRQPGEITLIAVTKAQPARAMVAAARAGQRVFGENYVQEALSKLAALEGEGFGQDVGGRGVKLHFIGHLQTNKVKKIIDKVSTIHTLDRPELAREIDKRSRARGLTVPALIEVNLAGETTKSGVAVEDLHRLAEMIKGLSGIKLIGLMAIPPFFADAAGVRPYFQRLRELREELNTRGFHLTELSMGMSHDFEVAIEEGATFVRVGTAIFGARGR